MRDKANMGYQVVPETAYLVAEVPTTVARAELSSESAKK